MTKEAVILAGGFGTRLSKVVTEVPKPMADINGKPFLLYLLEFLHQYDYTDVVISTGYMGDLIADKLGDRYKSLSLRYAREEEPLGTGGGLLHALNHTSAPTVLALNGDTVFPLDLKLFEEAHFSRRADFTLAARTLPDLGRFGSLQVDEENRVTAFREKGVTGEGLVNAGVYLINRDCFSRYSLPAKFSLEQDFLQNYLDELRIFAFSFPAYFIDIGIPEDYFRARNELPQLFPDL